VVVVVVVVVVVAAATTEVRISLHKLKSRSY